MTYPAASGHGNFPNGNAFPQVWADELIVNLRENLISTAITNTKYEGLIAEQGDTVNILKESITEINDYSRGAVIPDQSIGDEQVQLLIDSGKSFSFILDDVAKKLSHIDWASAQMNDAMFRLKKAVDTDILETMRDNGSTNAALGVSGTPKTIGYGTGDDYTPVNYLAKCLQVLEENDVLDQGLFFAVTPAFINTLRQEEGSLIDASVTGSMSVINGNMAMGSIFGVPLYKTTNMPLSAGSDVLVMAGNTASTSTATALIKTRTEKVQQTFLERFLGVVAYGKKVVRPEQLFIGNVSFS